jgi:uncharacterized membrane protein HdeD (DUF308 family)
MRYIPSLILLFLIILGAIPKSLQVRFHARFGWSPGRAMGLISSFLEFFLGVALIRYILLLRGYDTLTSGNIVFFGVLGFFFLMEGIFRLVINTKSQDLIPSFPIWILVSTIERIIRK